MEGHDDKPEDTLIVADSPRDIETTPWVSPIPGEEESELCNQINCTVEDPRIGDILRIMDSLPVTYPDWGMTII